MGCSAGKENTLERPGSGKLTVWGDFFNSDTRTILAILQIAGVPHDIQEIDQFKGDHKKESYLAQNPAGQIPMMTEGSFKILGGNNIFLIYLCNSHQKVKD
jgi:glutathione S-transferase